MNQRIDLNEEFRQWLSSRLNDALGNDVNNCNYVNFDLHQAREDHFWIVYDYIRNHKWDAPSKLAARIMNIRRATVYDKQKAQKMRKMHL